MLIPFKNIEERVISIEEKVLIDADVAELYGVQTREINQAVKNNPEKFPVGYILELNKEEKAELVKNFDHLQRLKFSKALPKAFTEKGLYMLATILKGEKATQTTLSIIETFAKIRELSRTISDLSEIKNKAEQKSLMQKSGEIISEILGEEMKTTDTETTVELNFAVLKLKHTIKRKTDKT